MLPRSKTPGRQFVTDQQESCMHPNLHRLSSLLREPQEISLALETREVLSEVAPGISFNYWTFNGQVPGPMLRIREGDVVNFTLRNHESSLHDHNIDLHAVTGPGGGGEATIVAP